MIDKNNHNEQVREATLPLEIRNENNVFYIFLNILKLKMLIKQLHIIKSLIEKIIQLWKRKMPFQLLIL
jgi:hypothetical protein